MKTLSLVGLLLTLLLGAPAAARPLVAVIDSGVAQTVELGPVLIAEYDMAGKRPLFEPRYDHGTMVATILARESHGQVGIVSFRIDDPAGCPAGWAPPCQSSAAPIVAAIRLATELRVQAINISLALKDDAGIADAVRDATAQGIIVVLAAGNNGLDHPGNLRMARAGYPRAVLVGALDASGQPWSGGNRPGAIRWFDYDYVWRRGVDVPTVDREGQPVFATGTSFAVPIEAARLMGDIGKTLLRSETASEIRTRNLRGPVPPARLTVLRQPEATGFEPLALAANP